MGAWNYGIFDDDTAYDFDDEIKSDAKGFFKSSFENAINSDYLEYDECHMVTVSAAYIDSYINGTNYRTDNEEKIDESNVNMLIKIQQDLKLFDLKNIAVKALKKVLSENSELNELWSDNEELYPKWKSNLEELINRLK